MNRVNRKAERLRMAVEGWIGYAVFAMSIKERIEADLKKAMLAKDVITRDTLRMLKSDLMKREIELGGEMSDSESIKILQRAVKSRTESIEQYEQAGRSESAETEKQEIAVIERYLPKQLDEAATRAAVESIATELGLSAKKDMGQLMKELRARHEGEIDMKLASKVASEILR